ncbi:MAG: hypothetical protein JWQ07_5193, partial [Ramlibacter sp.]|nr:hypothetical protein [Ramlibacter sp.]
CTLGRRRASGNEVHDLATFAGLRSRDAKSAPVASRLVRACWTPDVEFILAMVWSRDMPKSWVLAALLIGACGGNDQAAPDAAIVVDAGPDAPPPYTEAPHGTVPEVISLGGMVLATPRIVPIFFANDDTMKGQIEQFLAMLPSSSYWHATTSEYGVGDVTIGATIVSTDAVPATDTALEAWLSAQLDGTHAGWTFDPNTIYSVYLPAGAVLSTQFGTSCQAFGAYHSEIAGTGGQNIVYALMPRCGGGLNSLTGASSHEFIEAVTDPLPFSAGAYQDLDPDHQIWGMTPGAELGDMCEYLSNANQPILGTFVVQRTWSNASAKAGHDPCVPALAAPYQGAAPLLNEDITLDFGQGVSVMTKGVQVPLNMSKTIDVALFSDAPTADFTVRATQLSGGGGSGGPELMFAWDKTTGHNGDVLKLTITRKRVVQGGSEFLIVVGPQGGSTALWWAAAAN